MLQRYDPWGRPGGGAPNVSCSLYYSMYNIPFKSILPKLLTLTYLVAYLNLYRYEFKTVQE